MASQEGHDHAYLSGNDNSNNSMDGSQDGYGSGDDDEGEGYEGEGYEGEGDDGGLNNGQDELGGSYEVLEVLETAFTTELLSPPVPEVTSYRGKRGLPKTPSPPLAAQQRPPLARFHRSISTPRLHGPLPSPSQARSERVIEQWVEGVAEDNAHRQPMLQPSPQPLQRAQSLANFSLYREGISNPSLASTSSDNGQLGNALHSPPARYSFTQSSFFQRQASSSRALLASSPSFRHIPNPPSLEVLEGRRREIRDAHGATDGWYSLYEKHSLGSLPSPQESELAPPSQRPLAKIPIQQVARKNSVLMHFFAALSKTEYQCQVVKDSGAICGQVYKK
ncbi:hypothetical protein EDD21DRAFT_407957, partial [Dissophora ornata]